MSAVELSELESRCRELAEAGVIELPLDGSTAIAAGELSSLHGDPAERIIVAAALATGATLRAADRRIFDRRAPRPGRRAATAGRP